MYHLVNVFTYCFLFFSHLDSFFHNFNYIMYFILNYCNYRVYQLTSKEKKNLLFKTINKYNYICNKYDENNDPVGLVIHKSILPTFIIFYKKYQQEYLSIICKKSFYDELVFEPKTKEIIDLDEEYIPCKSKFLNKSINYITKSGEYGYFQYGSRDVNLDEINNDYGTTVEFYRKQSLLFKDIMEFYKSNHYCKIYLSGGAGQGKTYFGYIMAQKLNCYLCDVYKGNEPSSNFNEIYSRIKVSSEKPIILMFDEVDEMINDINNNNNDTHKRYSKEIYNKTSWNSFMDKIEYGMYPYVILLMTSNKKRKDIDKYDVSYLRDGRINVIKEW